MRGAKSTEQECAGGPTLTRECLEVLRQKIQSASSVDSMAGFLAIVGNPVRIRILLYLTEARELCVCDFASLLSMSNQAVSAHLNKMKLQGVLRSRRDGQMIRYSIADDERMEVLSQAFANLRVAMKL